LYTSTKVQGTRTGIHEPDTEIGWITEIHIPWLDYVKYLSYKAGNKLTVTYATIMTLENGKRSLYQAT